MSVDFPHPPGLIRDWQYASSQPGTKSVLSRIWRTTRCRRKGPDWECIRPMERASRWIGYFIFAQDGRLGSHHRFTLEKLKQHNARLAIVCAAASISAVPPELADVADALYWKDLPGFDFSAYSILVTETARLAPQAELIVMNDSVLGPFDDLHEVFDRAPWAVAGLTGYSLVENHIQSYAFRIRSVDDSVADRMATIAGPTLAYDRFQDVIYCQETRFARAMARGADAGALWFSDHRQGGGDLPLVWPMGLVSEGFPFIKRSLFTKFRGMADEVQLGAYLEQMGHPLPPTDSG